MILLRPDVTKKLFLFYWAKLLIENIFVCKGLEREICTVDEILKYGELFQKFVFRRYKHQQLRQYYTVKLLSLQRINLDYFHLSKNNSPYFYFHLSWISE